MILLDWPNIVYVHFMSRQQIWGLSSARFEWHLDNIQLWTCRIPYHFLVHSLALSLLYLLTNVQDRVGLLLISQPMREFRRQWSWFMISFNWNFHKNLQFTILRWNRQLWDGYLQIWMIFLLVIHMCLCHSNDCSQCYFLENKETYWINSLDLEFPWS